MAKRSFFMAVFVALISLHFEQAQADNDLIEQYIARAKDQIAVHPDSSKARSATRKIINLNGTWQAKGAGEQDWTEVWVPGAYDFEGSVDFRRSFLLDSSFVGNAFKLVAFGINSRCTIFLNGEFVTSHEGGHTSFTIGLGGHELFFDKENEIRILVDNLRHPRKNLPLQHSPQLVRNLGGIFRDIFIIAVPHITVDAFHIKTVFQENYMKGQLSLTCSLKIGTESSLNDDPLSLQMRLFDPAAQRPIASNSESIEYGGGAVEKDVTLEVKGIQPWTPDVPKLYSLEISIVQNRQILDDVRVRIGFNEFRVRNRRFLLNGQPFVVRGVDWVEDYGSSGPAAGWEQIKKEIELIKGLGANVIRVIGTPPHPYFLDLCDELGMLVFLEMPLSLVPEARFRSSEFSSLAVNYFSEALAMGANHPSVVAWGLGADYSIEQVQTQSFLNNLRQVAVARPGRMLYLVSRFLPLSSLSSVDFGLLEFTNRGASESINSVVELNVNKPIVVSFGYTIASAQQPDSPGQQNDWPSKARPQTPQEIQAEKTSRVLADPRLPEKTAGYLLHTFNDWRQTNPNIISGPFDDAFVNRTGLVDLRRQKRIAYEVVRSVFTGEDALKIAPSVESNANPNIYPIIGLGTILFFLFNFQRSRRLRGNLRRSFLYPHGFYQELAANRKVGALHTLILGSIVWLTLSVILSSILFNYRESAVANALLDLLLLSPEMKINLTQLIWYPVGFIIVSTLSLFLIYVLLSFVLRVVSFILGQNLAFRRFFTLVCWSNSSFVLLLPVVPIFYRIMNRPGWAQPAIWILALFFVWGAVRLFRALRVVYPLTLMRTFLLATILLAIMFGSIGWYYESRHALFDYLPIYWKIIMRG